MRTGSLAITFAAAVLAAFWLGVKVATREPIADPPPADPPVAGAPDVLTPPHANTPPDALETLDDILRTSGDFAQTTALYVLAAHADESTLVRLLDEAALLLQLSERDAATAILYQRFADLAPTSAVDDALQRGGAGVERALGGISYAWSRRDLAAAVERAVGLPEPLRSAATLAVLRARDDLPDDERRRIAIELAASTQLEYMLATEGVRRWNDPEVGWAAVQRMPESPQRLQQLGAIALNWSRRDPEAALAAVPEGAR